MGVHVVLLLCGGEEPARPEFKVGGDALPHILIGDFEGAREGGAGAASFAASWLFFGFFILGEEDGAP
jgi:hypothetical protein